MLEEIKAVSSKVEALTELVKNTTKDLENLVD
jgi:hypothetical protein